MSVQLYSPTSVPSFIEVKSATDSIIWNKLDCVTLDKALNEWLGTLSNRTRINYQSGIRILMEHCLLNPMLTLQAFSQVNHDAIVDKIKLIPGMKETTRQARAALYISFTRFLSRRFPGIFKKAMPSKEGTSKTFYRVHEKVVTQAMNQSQWVSFFDVLQKINSRDCLLAKIALQGGKRIGEVLTMKVDQINWEEKQIIFKQSKTKGVRKETVITYPESVMQALRKHIGDRQGYVFITSSGNPVQITQVTNTFVKAGVKAGIPFKVKPHVLRASAVTYYKSQGFSDSDIQKITGHASSEMVNAYDKSSRADNASKKVNLIS